MSNILEQVDKYYIYAVSSKKAILLASSDEKTKLRELALKKLELGEKINKTKAEKYNGVYLFRIKLMKVPKKDLTAESNSKIKMIGGPIVAIVERIQINIGNNGDNIKLKSIDNENVTNKIYFSPVYLKKYSTIKTESINKIAFDFAHKKFNSGLFAVNTLNN